MHGGSRLLFYRDVKRVWPDRDGTIDGLECRLWWRGRLGMHARDLNQLADVLEGTDQMGEEIEGLEGRFELTSEQEAPR